MTPLALSLRLLQAQPDERLVRLASQGHEPAFEALVRRYRKPLLAYCRRVAPELTAEDLLQQALLQAWRALAAGVQVRDARAWLYRITHNVAISARRARLESVEKLGDAVPTAGVEHLVEQRLAAREALAHLAALPPLQREVMLGTALEGRSHEEVATELGLTGGSVRGLIYRARATLRAAAAALIPSPVIEWATRHHQTGRGGAGSVYEMVAGGSSAGVAAAVVKAGTVVTVASVIAGTAAVVGTHPFQHRRTPLPLAQRRAGHQSSRQPRPHPLLTASVDRSTASPAAGPPLTSTRDSAAAARLPPRPRSLTPHGAGGSIDVSLLRPSPGRRSSGGSRQKSTGAGGSGVPPTGTATPSGTAVTASAPVTTATGGGSSTDSSGTTGSSGATTDSSGSTTDSSGATNGASGATNGSTTDSTSSAAMPSSGGDS